MQESCNLEYVRVYIAIRFHQIKAVPYSAIYFGCRFFGKRNKEKNRCAAGESVKGGAVSPCQWGAGAKPRKILAILHSE